MKIELLREFIGFLKGQDPAGFCTRDWQQGPRPAAETLEELHECGNLACIGGYLALWPRFQEAGGEGDFSSRGCPVINRRYGARAFAYFFDLPLDKARLLLVRHALGEPTIPTWSRWTISDAVRALTLLCDYPELSTRALCDEINRGVA